MMRSRGKRRRLERAEAVEPERACPSAGRAGARIDEGAEVLFSRW